MVFCHKRLFPSTFHFEDGVLRHFFAVALNLLLDSLLEVFVGRADHHGLALEAGKQAHLPLLTRGRQVSLAGGEKEAQLRFDFTVTGFGGVSETYVIQDVVPLLASCDLDKLSQEKWRPLGNGSQLRNVL